MKEENNKGGVLKKIKNAFILLIVALLLGMAVGYYIGFDIGFEKAVRILAK